MSGNALAATQSRAIVKGGAGSALTTLAVIVLVAAVLHIGKEIFLPLALAVLLAFALSPMVSFLRRRGAPSTVSAVTVVLAVASVVGLFVIVVAGQLAQLADELPRYQYNMIDKLDDIPVSDSDSGLMSRLSAMMDAITTRLEDNGTIGAGGEADDAPVKVEVVEVSGPGEVFRTMLLPILAPVAAAGLIVVVIMFMLIEREDLRDRFIRLVGWHDINRTTRMIEEAARRVSRYLLVQVIVNVIYAVPIGVGLWLIGVPNAVLFGIITLVLRFIPYIGSFISAALPLLMAFAVSPNWSLVLWTAGLFLLVELVTSNFIEPHLYGSRTGLSPLAVIVSAVLWTWIWGPMGLILSTPLTVCLVVLGRHIPQFEFFSILFGDEPALSPHSRLYQRLLSGDVHESTARAEEAIEDVYLAEYYRDVAIPALQLAQLDFNRGMLTSAQEERIAETALRMVRELDPLVEEERKLAEREAAASDHDSEGEAGQEAKTVLDNGILDGLGRSVIVIGGRSRLDDVAAALVGQALEAEGASTTVMPVSATSAGEISTVAATEGETVLLSFLDGTQTRAMALQIRRLKRAAPSKRVGLLIWPSIDASVDGAPLFAPVAEQVLQQALAQGADFAVTSLEDAVVAAFVDEKPKPLPQVRRNRPARPLYRNELKGAA